jgi:iron complex outermembrane receptor protein
LVPNFTPASRSFRPQSYAAGLMWNAAPDRQLSYHQKADSSNVLWYARADNLGDVLAYPVTSILTQTAPGKVPLPGRSLKLGVQLIF